MNKKNLRRVYHYSRRSTFKHYSFTKTISNIYDSISFFLVS